jgi:hypothetical protein
MAVKTREPVKTKVKTGPKGVRVAVSAEELEQAGIHAGEEVVLEVRPYDSEDWLRDNEGRIYYSNEEFTEALEEYCALPEGTPPRD